MMVHSTAYAWQKLPWMLMQQLQEELLLSSITAVIKSKQAYNWKMDSFAISQSDSG